MVQVTVLDELILTPLNHDHLEPLHCVFSDPRTWSHLPTGRFTDQRQTEQLIEVQQQSWTQYGLGNWAVFDQADEIAPSSNGTKTSGVPALGAFLGMVGVVHVNEVPAWNYGFRLHPDAWGKGISPRVGQLALSLANDLEPNVPVTARALTTNPASLHVIQKSGLTLQWEGPASIPVPYGARSQIFADRKLSSEVLNWLIARA